MIIGTINPFVENSLFPELFKITKITGIIIGVINKIKMLLKFISLNFFSFVSIIINLSFEVYYPLNFIILLITKKPLTSNGKCDNINYVRLIQNKNKLRRYTMTNQSITNHIETIQIAINNASKNDLFIYSLIENWSDENTSRLITQVESEETGPLDTIVGIIASTEEEVQEFFQNLLKEMPAELKSIWETADGKIEVYNV